MSNHFTYEKRNIFAKKKNTFHISKKYKNDNLINISYLIGISALRITRNGITPIF